MVATPALNVDSSPRRRPSLRSPRGRLAIVAVGAVLSAGLIAGCSSSTPAATGSAAAPGTTVAATSAAGTTSGSSAAAATQPIIHISSFKYTVPARSRPARWSA